MEKTIEEIRVALKENKIDIDSITHDYHFIGTALKNWVYWISLNDDWKEHARLRNVMRDLGYTETDRRITEDTGDDFFGADYRFSLTDGVELFK